MEGSETIAVPGLYEVAFDKNVCYEFRTKTLFSTDNGKLMVITSLPVVISHSSESAPGGAGPRSALIVRRSFTQSFAIAFWSYRENSIFSTSHGSVGRWRFFCQFPVRSKRKEINGGRKTTQVLPLAAVRELSVGLSARLGRTA